MKTLNTLLVLTSLTTAVAFGATVNFDDSKPGEVPVGWTATKTGKIARSNVLAVLGLKHILQ